MRTRLAPCLLLVVALAWPASSCKDDDKVDQLLLEVRSDPPVGGGPIDSIRVLLSSGDVRYPASANDPSVNFAVPPGRDITTSPALIAMDYDGQTFGQASLVDVYVAGRQQGRVVAAWQGQVDLAEVGVVAVHLQALTDACDVDGDGFLDCSVQGCCAGSDALSDCEPDVAEANPWGTEAACEPCDDDVDQDCDGTDTPCVDADGDLVADCLETACGAGDPNVGPGLAELCDGVDNDCDGETDEDFSAKGVAVGGECGTGICADGTVECDGTGAARCSTDDLAKGTDICGNGEDDDCNGLVDDGCGSGDLDGDGYSIDGGDCNDWDAGIFPGAPEPCCPASAAGDPEAEEACDKDCSGTPNQFCDAADADGDGYAPPDDCDDTDPLTYPGAPEACGDGIDQDCFGGDTACTDVTDGDGDGWSPPADCDDGDGSVNPAAQEICNGVDDDCNDLVDDGNPGGGEVCGTDEGECSTGIGVCVKPSSTVACIGADEEQPEVCDGLDNDCDGLTDEDFVYGPDSTPLGQPCDGVGACGLGTVECNPGGTAAICSTDPDGSASEVTAEVCDGLDNDCDGELNEGLTDVAQSSCSTLGVCGLPGAVVGAVCKQDTSGTWECDYSGVPNYSAGAEPACDGLDNDCDGFIDEDFGVGLGCDGDDEDECLNGKQVCNATGDGVDCDESQAQDAVEVCDGADNDCDGETDEDFGLLGQACDGSDSDQCPNGTYTCAADGSAETCVNETVTDIPELCNDQDDDCDGQTDEDFTTLGDACDGDDSDQCQNGTFTCKGDGSGVECANESVENIPELCNDQDDDCDGQTDEDFTTLGDDCDGDDADLCANGTFTCNGDGSGVECANESVENIPELCNGQDDDCDGQNDEDFTTLGDACDGNDSDQCANGTLTCTGDGLGVECVNETVNVVETCNNLDDDCDGQTDEDVTNVADSDCKQVGVCTSGVAASCSAGTWQCDYSGVTGYTADETGAAWCDDLDNDCDGLTDENHPAKGDACDSLDSDMCAYGTLGCSADKTTVECQNDDPSGVVESCNGLDDDCDGETDEDNVCGGICEPVEVCGDCINNDCSGGTDTGTCYYRRTIGIATVDAVPAGYSVSLTFDHAAMVAAGRSDVSGDDVRLFYFDGATYTEIDRVLDPESSWNNTDTTLWFALQTAVGAASESTDYVLYHSGAGGVLGGTVLEDEGNVFHFADFFDRADSDTVGNGWNVAVTTGNVDIAADHLFFNQTDDGWMNPRVVHTFPALTGSLEWRLSMDWDRTGDESTYNLFMQLGDSATMNSTPNSSANVHTGIGPGLMWGGNDLGGHEILGYYSGGSATATNSNVDGVTAIRATVDLAGGTFDYTVDGATGATGVGLASGVTSVDSIRLVAHALNDINFSGRRFDYVIVRPLVAVEPSLSLDAPSPMSCALVDTGLVARYYLDEASSGAPGTVLDSASGPVNLVGTQDAGEPVYEQRFGRRGLRWDTIELDGRVSKGMSGTKLNASMTGRKTATIEVSVDIDAVSSQYSRIFHVGQGSEAGRLTLRTDSTSEMTFWMSNVLFGVWNIDLPAAGRVVLTLVLDTTANNASDRVKLYRDGALLPSAGGFAPVSQDATISILADRHLVLGNREAGGRSPQGRIHYAAMYNQALDAGEVMQNALILLADDDAP